MTTIEHVYAALRALLTEYGDKHGYSPSSDPFSFDQDPRGGSAWYVDPPESRSTGLVGDTENVTAAIAVWLSRDAGQDASGAAVALAGDLARLRHAVVGLDFDGLPGDVNLHQDVRAHVQPRAAGAVTVVGRLALSLDYIATAANP